MESPNPVIDPPAPGGGVAMMPMSAGMPGPMSAARMRSLISDSQGPRPLSNVFAYHAASHNRTRSRGVNTRRTAANRYAGVGGPYPAFVARPPRDAETDERKRPADGQPAESGSSSTEEDMPPLIPRQRVDAPDQPEVVSSVHPSVSISVSTTVSAPAPVHPSPPNTRSSRKRKSDEMESSAKRPAVAAADGKPAGNLKADPEDDFSDAGSCCICMCDPDDGERATIDGCDHEFCFDCIGKWSERENTCPLCKVRFSRINREGSKRKGQKATKKVKQRDQRADLNPGNALEGLLGKFA